MESIGVNCFICNKDTVLYLNYTTIKETITKFVLNPILHHMGMSWIICSKNEMLYEIEKNDHPNWFN